MKIPILLCLLLTLFSAVNAQNAPADSSRYIKTPTGYLMVLRQGDSVFQQIERLAKKENIPSANLSGMGFLGHVRFGFFNAETKEFEPKDFTDVELANLTGSIAWEAGQPSLHLHGVVGDRNMQTSAGHMLAAVVGTGSLEILVVIHDKKLARKQDPAIGAKVLQLKDY